MRTLILATLGLAGITSGALAAGTAAPSGVSGDVMGYVGATSLTDYSDPSFDLSGSVFGGAGRVMIALSPQMSAQFDLSGEHLKDNLGADYSVYDVAGHLAAHGDNFLVGVLGSYGSTNNSEMDGTFATLGVDAQAGLGTQALLSAQAGYTHSLTVGSGYDVSAPYVRGALTYFLTPNMSISANLGVVHEVYDGDADPLDAVSWGGDLEYRMDNSPLSLVASYRGSYSREASEGESWATHLIAVGIKVNFGSDTLQQAATSGAALRDHNPITGVDNLIYNNWE